MQIQADDCPSSRLQERKLQCEKGGSGAGALAELIAARLTHVPSVLKYPMVWCGAILPLMHRH